MGESERGTRTGGTGPPHHATVIAWLALFVALGGVASGLPGEVGPVDIRDGAVRSQEIRDGRVNEVDLADSAVTPFKLGPVPAARVDTPAQAPGCAAQVIEDPSPEVVQFSVEEFDTQNLHTDPPADCAAGTQSRLTAPIDGIYAVSGQVLWPSDPTGMRVATLRKTDSGGAVSIARAAGPGSNTQFQALSTVVALVPGDYVELEVSQSSGGDLALGSQLDNYLTLAWLAPGP